MAYTQQRRFPATAPRFVVAAMAGIFVLTVCAARAAQAQSFQVIHTFSGGGDGGNPNAGLTPDRPGSFYGTTFAGGTHNEGLVFKLNQSGSGWVINPLYSFGSSPNDGYTPLDRAIIGPDGALYGTTYAGGANLGGTIYRLTPPATTCRSILCSWTETVLHNFPASDGDGFYPEGDLAFDQAGNIYGTTPVGGSGQPNGCGGSGCGIVYQLMHSQGMWAENIVYGFTGESDGGNPYTGVVLDQAGNIYGAACGGGPNYYGVDFQITASGWVETPIYTFTGFEDGMCPYGLSQDGSGNLYGTSGNTGFYGNGAVYELSPGNGNWNFELLYVFTSGDGGSSNLTLDSSGNLYGTTADGGAYSSGTVFKLTYSGGSWIYSSLYDFTGGSDGKYPYGQVVLDANGNVFGTARNGGNSGCDGSGCGVIFEITP